MAALHHMRMIPNKSCELSYLLNFLDLRIGIIFGGIFALILLSLLVMLFTLSCDDLYSDPKYEDIAQSFSRENCTILKIGKVQELTYYIVHAF